MLTRCLRSLQQLKGINITPDCVNYLVNAKSIIRLKVSAGGGLLTRGVRGV
jgi:hypothetical protein